MGYFTCDVNWQESHENYAINAQAANQTKPAVVLIILSDLWLHIEQQSPRRPCDNTFNKYIYFSYQPLQRLL